MGFPSLKVWFGWFARLLWDECLDFVMDWFD